ncbi:hypothetical protein [Gemella haemolysans]|nr:hypothetical protein [Gemella haemolysans]
MAVSGVVTPITTTSSPLTVLSLSTIVEASNKRAPFTYVLINV